MEIGGVFGVDSDWMAVETRLFARAGGDPICELGPVPPFLLFDSPRFPAIEAIGGKRRFVERSVVGGSFSNVNSRGNRRVENRGEIGTIVSRVPRFFEAAGGGDASSSGGANCGIPQIRLYRICEIGMEMGFCGKGGSFCGECDGSVGDRL